MENKQTAVEWLEQVYWDNKRTLSQKHFDQAKEMEKEQIIDSYEQGDKYKLNFSGEQYHKEIYGDKI